MEHTDPMTSSDSPLDEARVSLGVVRAEALLTDRAAYYVYYLGSSSRDRIITVRETDCHCTVTVKSLPDVPFHTEAILAAGVPGGPRRAPQMCF